MNSDPYVCLVRVAYDHAEERTEYKVYTEFKLSTEGHPHKVISITESDKVYLFTVLDNALG